MPQAPHVKMETLTRFLFSAPSWRWSILVIILLGLTIDAFTYLANIHFWLPGTTLFTLPALGAFLLTKPSIDALGGVMTWNRSALLALVCTIIAIAGTFVTMFAPSTTIFPFLFAYALGFIFALRLLVLAAVADYRIARIFLPASLQSIFGVIAGTAFFGTPFAIVALISNGALSLGCVLLIWLIDLPLYRAFRVHGLQFINLFLAHLTDGSRDLEGFFRQIGEEAVVPQTTFLFKRPDSPHVMLTIPNLHPGPMGEIGGTNLPSRFQEAFDGEVLVCHGCATHDFNIVAANEIDKIIGTVKASLDKLDYRSTAGRSIRFKRGSVSILSQKFGDALLIVATRSPEKTEDINPAVGQIIMAEGEKWYRTIGFVDAHNCMTEVTTPVHPSTPLASEYIAAAREAVSRSQSVGQGSFRIGVARIVLPFSREEGFGSLGIQALVVAVDGQKTAYVLIDGNNIVRGGRDILLSPLMDLVDEAEVMTTDSHVVNTISGKNPIGLQVQPSEIAPYVATAVRQALDTLAPAEVASTTARCEGIMVFGAERISQIASTVNTIVIFLIPLSLSIILLAFFLSIIAYLLMI